MLERAGLTAQSVPERGRVVYLRSTANLSTGGTATDVTDVIHPDNRDMAVRAIRAIGLDVGGVDFLSQNIAESYRTIGGGICEVNAAGFACTSRRARARRATLQAPSSTCCSRRARRRACRSRRHRHERQDDDCAHARAHHEDGRLHPA